MPKAPAAHRADPAGPDKGPKGFCLFCGNLSNSVNDDLLRGAFSEYRSISQARVIRDSFTKKSKGYGFVSFADGREFLRALKEKQGAFIGDCPVQLRKSNKR